MSGLASLEHNSIHPMRLLFRNISYSNTAIKRISAEAQPALCCRHASHSSHSWLTRQRKDIYKKMARYDNYRARSAFKLIQIDDKYKFLKPGKIVIDVGAAPGSWTQVICERLQLSKNTITRNGAKDKSGLCIAVDIAAIPPVDGAICLGNADITSPFTQGSILTWLDSRQVDCVLSDMAPNCSGQKSFDHTRAVNLIKGIIPFTLQVLKPGDGVFLFKLWNGSETQDLVDSLESRFEHIKCVKPQASRGDSSEIYVMCRGFKGAD
uniref:rRNA methyltransferase 2, mitochondrial n=1 Tax=Aceria tosichella TaxID=561515 RepID=A0A6G1SG82_9ACAR